MSDTVLVAIISGGSSMVIAVTALILSYRGFASIDSRFASLDSRFASLDSRFASIDARFAAIDARFAAIDRRLEVIEADLKQFYRMLADHDKRISRLEDREQ